jgi:hypothetical protein
LADFVFLTRISRETSKSGDFTRTMEIPSKKSPPILFQLENRQIEHSTLVSLPDQTYPGRQTNLRKSVGFTRITKVRFLLKFGIFTRIILNLRPNFENFTRIIELRLRRGFSGVLTLGLLSVKSRKIC